MTSKNVSLQNIFQMLGKRDKKRPRKDHYVAYRSSVKSQVLLEDALRIRKYAGLNFCVNILETA